MWDFTTPVTSQKRPVQHRRHSKTSVALLTSTVKPSLRSQNPEWSTARCVFIRSTLIYFKYTVSVYQPFFYLFYLIEQFVCCTNWIPSVSDIINYNLFYNISLMCLYKLNPLSSNWFHYVSCQKPEKHPPDKKKSIYWHEQYACKNINIHCHTYILITIPFILQISCCDSTINKMADFITLFYYSLNLL